MENLEKRGIGIRFVALFIDTIVLFVLGYVIAIPIGMTSATGFNLQGGPAFLWILIGFGYFIVLEGKYGKTVGKRLVGIEVVTEDGRPIDYQASLIRNVLRIIDGIFFYLVGAILVILSEDEQRLGDRIANTIVVSTS
ncbi:MAG: RDD family protein [Halodesulfurarchaeum sp.]